VADNENTQDHTPPGTDQIIPEKSTAVRKRSARDFIQAFLFTLLAAVLLKAFVVEAFRIPTGSMEETLLEGDFLLVNKFILGVRTPRTIPLTNITLPVITLAPVASPAMGDVIIFNFPGSRDEISPHRAETYIKRCIGLPGDTIEIINKTVHINGSIVTNPPSMKYQSFEIRPRGQPNTYIFPPGSGYNEDNYGPIVVPKRGMVIPIDMDTIDRWYVFIRREGHEVEIRDNGILIDGRLSESYTVERDYLFMMGDNRDNSLDSRFWGFVPVDNVIGKAMLIYFSWDKNIPSANVFDKLSSIRWHRIGSIIK
jgi:signal peptidase I